MTREEFKSRCYRAVWNKGDKALLISTVTDTRYDTKEVFVKLLSKCNDNDLNTLYDEYKGGFSPMIKTTFSWVGLYD